MGRNPKIKLRILSEKQLNEIIACNKCGTLELYRDLYFYVDESNIAITYNAKGVCKKCK